MSSGRPPRFGPSGIFLEGNVLRVHKELQWPDYPDFEQKCKSLLDTDGTEVIVDLSTSAQMFSTLIGIIAAVAVEAHGIDKKLTLRLPEGLLWVARNTGLHELLNIEQVD